MSVLREADSRLIFIDLKGDRALPTKVGELIVFLTERLATVPAEFSDEVRVQTTLDYEDSTVSVSFGYERLETADEVKARIAERERIQHQAELRERATYDRLREKFEPKTVVARK